MEAPRRTAGRAAALPSCLVVALLGCALLLAAPAAAAGNPVQAENALPGDAYWQAAVGNPAPASVIQGYSSSVSAAPGQSMSFHVSSSAAYRIEIDRLGWYGGSGGRRVACIPSCTGSRAGVVQAAPHAPDPTTGELDARWAVTDSVTVQPSWLSGYYLAEFVVTAGPNAGQASAYPFIVRAPASRQSAILVQAPVNTMQAYNNWGGKSLYAFNSTGGKPATMVSFNRPFTSPTSQVTRWDYQLVRFLERNGYDVAYTTDVDVDTSPAELLRHSLDMSAGHDEYWSKAMRDAFESARNSGHNLAFMGADEADWQIRYADSRRTVIEYRSRRADPEKDPALKTIRFSDLSQPRPECELVGVQYEGGLVPPNATSPDYAVVPAGLSDPWMSGTGFRAGDTVNQAVGYEMDRVVPGCRVPALTRFFTSDGTLGGRSMRADAVRYTAPSGARVFSTGSLQFVWGLDNWSTPAPADPRLQRFALNVLDNLAPGSRALPASAPAPAPAVATPPPVVRCTQAAAPKVVARHASARRGRGRTTRQLDLLVALRCDQSATVTVTGTVKRWTRAKAHKRKVRRMRVQSAALSAAGGTAFTARIHLPRAAVAALTSGARVAAALTFTATNATGSSSGSWTIPRLRPPASSRSGRAHR